MSFLDDVGRALTVIVEGVINGAFGTEIDLNADGAVADPLDSVDVADDILDQAFGSIFDAVEDDALEPFAEGGLLTPDNIERKIDEAEGSALQNALTVIAANLGVEIAGGTQLESHEFISSEILTYLILDDVLGARSAMMFEKGVGPALEARIAKNTQSEFVALPDAVEFALRKKQGDRGWLGGQNTPQVVRDRIGSNEPVDPDNILEEWGLRPDQRAILEETSLEAIEAEELLESPVQFGIVPDPELVETNARRAGLPEAAIDLFVETAESVPNSSDLWEQRTQTEALIGELDTAVDKGEITAVEAGAILPESVSEARPALVERWQLLGQTPNKPPTRSQVESSFTWGLTDLSTLTDRLDRLDVDPEKYEDIIDATILDDLDGDLRTAVGLGLLSENQYVSYARRVGLDQDAINALLGTQDLDDYADSVLVDDQDPTGLGLTSIIDVGTSRAAALRAAGVEDVGGLAQADPEGVAEVLAITPEFSRTLIDRAARRVN